MGRLKREEDKKRKESIVVFESNPNYFSMCFKSASLARPPCEGGGDAAISFTGSQSVHTGDDVTRLLCRLSASIPVEGKRGEAKGLESVKRGAGGVCWVSSAVAQSADSSEDNSSRPPLAAIGCAREGTHWAAGSHHLQNQQCYRAA